MSRSQQGVQERYRRALDALTAPLARLEGRVALEVIFERVPNFRLAGEVERLHISTERGLARLPLAV